MKQVLLLKYVDIAGQVLILLLLFLILPSGNRVAPAICYLALRIWQLTSCTVVAASGGRPTNTARRFYGKMLLGVHGLFAVGFVFALIAGPFPLAAFCKRLVLTEASLVLVLEPVMAVWYLTITLEEIRSLRLAIHHRAEIHWKL